MGFTTAAVEPVPAPTSEEVPARQVQRAARPAPASSPSAAPPPLDAGARRDVFQMALSSTRIRQSTSSEQAPTGRREVLPADVRAGVESLSGHSMADVTVHYGSSRPAMVGAHAYAVGREIHVAPGREQHLPHEAWHVVQQAEGRVPTRIQLAGGQPLNDDVALEREADAMGAKAMAIGSSVRRSVLGDRERPVRVAHSTSGAAPMQRYVIVNNAAGAVAVNALPGPAGVVPNEFEAQRPPQPGDAGPAVLVAGAPATLRVSEDGQMAIEDSNLTGRQPKMFYAVPGIWMASNLQLARSQYELYADRVGAVTITLPGQGPRVLDRVMARVKVPPGTVRTAQQQGLGLRVDADCIMVATAIIGNPPGFGQDRQTVAANNQAMSRTSGEYQTAQAMLAWARARSQTMWPNTWWELAMTGTNQRATRKALKHFQDALGGGPGMQAIAQQYAQLRQNNPALADQAIAALGINQHVEPNVGEAYESFQLGLPTNYAAGPGPDYEADPTGATMAELTTQAPGAAAPTRHGWGQHIGAVVAVSAGNRVTLENYARSHELGQMRTGPDYYFQMYGPPQLPNQTWHHAWTAGAVHAGLPPVKNAVTILVRR